MVLTTLIHELWFKATREDLLSSTSQRTLWPADHSDAFCSHRTRAVNCLEWCGGQGFWKDRERRSGLSVWLAQRCITSALLGTLCTPVAYTSRTYTLICTCNYVDINRSFFPCWSFCRGHNIRPREVRRNQSTAASDPALKTNMSQSCYC